MSIVKMFQILAAALIGAAAFFLWRGDRDTAFVTAVLGICAFFLSLRFTFKSRFDEQNVPDGLVEPDLSETDREPPA